MKITGSKRKVCMLSLLYFYKNKITICGELGILAHETLNTIITFDQVHHDLNSIYMQGVGCAIAAPFDF